jgi:hypothetical protein
MKKHSLLLQVAGMVSLMAAGQLHADEVRRVHLQAVSAQLHLVVAAEGIEGVGGSF